MLGGFLIAFIFGQKQSNEHESSPKNSKTKTGKWQSGAKLKRKALFALKDFGGKDWRKLIMNKTAISILEAIQKSIHSPYEGKEFSEEEKLKILDDLIHELKVEKNYIKSIDRIKKAKKQLAAH